MIDSQMVDRLITLWIAGYLATMYKFQKLFSKALKSKDDDVM